MRITVKGQVTVPLALRERYGLRPGTEVEFVPETTGLQIKARKRTRNATKPFDAWLAKAAGSSTGGLSTDEIMTMTRGED